MASTAGWTAAATFARVDADQLEARGGGALERRQKEEKGKNEVHVRGTGVGALLAKVRITEFGRTTNRE